MVSRFLVKEILVEIRGFRYLAVLVLLLVRNDWPACGGLLKSLVTGLACLLEVLALVKS